MFPTAAELETECNELPRPDIKCKEIKDTNIIYGISIRVSRVLL